MINTTQIDELTLKIKALLKKGISMCTEAQCLGALSKDNEIYISCDKFGDMPRRRAYENVGLQSFGKCLSRLRNANLKRKTEKKRKKAYRLRHSNIIYCFASIHLFTL